MKTTSFVLIPILILALQGCYTQLLIEESESASEQIEQPYEPFFPGPIIIVIPEPCPLPAPVWPHPSPVIIRPVIQTPPPSNPHRESGPQRTGSENSQQTSNGKGSRTEGAKRSG